MITKLMASTAFILLAVLSGCSNMTVRTDFDPDIDFSKYKTYSWMKQDIRSEKSPIYNNSLVDKRIRLAVDEELLNMGYVELDEGQPDFFVAYYVGVNDKLRVTNYGYRYWGSRHRVRDFQVYHYKEGTLIIDIVDPQLSQLIWRGWATQVMDSISPTEDQIKKAVDSIMAQFPPLGENRP